MTAVLAADRRPGRAGRPRRAAARLVVAALGAVAGLRRDVRRGGGHDQRAEPRRAVRFRRVRLGRAGGRADRAGGGADAAAPRATGGRGPRETGRAGTRREPEEEHDDHARGDGPRAGPDRRSGRSPRSRSWTSTWTAAGAQPGPAGDAGPGHMDQPTLDAAVAEVLAASPDAARGLAPASSGTAACTGKPRTGPRRLVAVAGWRTPRADGAAGTAVRRAAVPVRRDVAADPGGGTRSTTS